MKLLENIRGVFRTLNHRKVSKKYCPRCGCPNIHLSTSLDYWLTPRKYVCDECGYVGPVFMELEKEESCE